MCEVLIILEAKCVCLVQIWVHIWTLDYVPKITNTQAPHLSSLLPLGGFTTVAKVGEFSVVVTSVQKKCDGHLNDNIQSTK